MKSLKEFVVDRSKWYRGHGPENSALLLDDDTNRMCCLGFACRAAGIKKRDILDKAMPPDVVSVAAIPAWLMNTAKCATVSRIARTNDNKRIKEADREKRLKALFWIEGVRVKFVGKSPAENR